MPAFARDIAGQTAHVVVPDELAAFYRAQPEYVEVEDVGGVFVPADEAADVRAALEERAELEAHVAELAGADLDRAVKAAKVAHPSSLTADEKRQALVEAAVSPTDEGDLDTDPTIKES